MDGLFETFEEHPLVRVQLTTLLTEHINRFGKHVLNFSRNPEPVVLDFRKAPGRETSILTSPGIRKMGDTRIWGGSDIFSARIVLAVGDSCGDLGGTGCTGNQMD